MTKGRATGPPFRCKINQDAAFDWNRESDMDNREVTETYMVQLHSIEQAIIAIYRQNEELVDWDVLRVVETLINEYQAKRTDRATRSKPLQPNAQEVYENVRPVCESLLEQSTMKVETQEKKFGIFPIKVVKEIPVASISIDEIILCLKSLRGSIQFWSKESGRQGYLEYVNKFIE
jgi:hypothetical protein